MHVSERTMTPEDKLRVGQALEKRLAHRGRPVRQLPKEPNYE